MSSVAAARYPAAHNRLLECEDEPQWQTTCRATGGELLRVYSLPCRDGVARSGAGQSPPPDDDDAGHRVSGHGRTASGKRVHRGMVAADRRVLPLGTKVRLKNAGPYSGVYRVEDTGGRIRGRRIDIYMPSRSAAKQFGRQTVKVEVLTPQKRRRQGVFAWLLFWRRS